MSTVKISIEAFAHFVACTMSDPDVPMTLQQVIADMEAIANDMDCADMAECARVLKKAESEL